MIILSNNDIYTVKLSTLIADYDKNTIINLYQPLVGATAVALYFYLLVESENQEVTTYSTHEELLVHMQLSTSEFIKARKMLEAVGLIKTYISGDPEELKTYEYYLYAPKSPAAFFDDTLLYGVLIKYVGIKAADKLKSIYKIDNSEPQGNDASSTFGEMFHPNFDDPAFARAANGKNTIGRKVAKIDSEFSYDRFFDALTAISQIKKNSLTKKEMKEIERIATLYGVDETNTASIVNHLYNANAEKGKRINISKMSEMLQNEVNYNFLARPKGPSARNFLSSSTDLAEKINLMEMKSPKEFLSILSNCSSEIATPDLKLLNDLSHKFNLTNGVINALVDFVLNRNDNVLSRAYCEKIAGSLTREGITSTIDAMNYLNGTLALNSSFEKKENETSKKAIKRTKKSDKIKEEEEYSSWDELLAQYK